MRGIELGIALSFLVPISTPALAVDGVLEISQACAVNTGCFAGDSPGYPVTIALPSTGTINVRLTSNLTTSGGGTTMIDISGGGVGTPSTVIDLNGFSMSCFNLLGGCSGSGIGVSAVGVSRVTVMNGGVVHVGGDGVRLGDDCVVKNMRISNNGGTGILVGENCVVTANVVEGNGVDGISVGGNAQIIGNTVDGNAANGINQNATGGGGCLVAKNVVSNNAFNGVILSSLGSNVLDNVIRTNETGLACSLGCGYGNNVITQNTRKDVAGISEVEIDTNFCGLDTTCP
jgi:hypothetical protein